MRPIPIFLLLGALVFKGCASASLVIPAGEDILKNKLAVYGEKVKECVSSEVILRVFLKQPAKSSQDLWEKDAFIVFIPRLKDKENEERGFARREPLILGIVHEIENRKDNISRTFSEIFIIESFVSEKDLMPSEPDELIRQKSGEFRKKIFSIIPSRDITLEHYFGITSSIASAYMTLVDTCLMNY